MQKNRSKKMQKNRSKNDNKTEDSSRKKTMGKPTLITKIYKQLSSGILGIVLLVVAIFLMVHFMPRLQRTVHFLATYYGQEFELNDYEEYAKKDFSNETALLNAIRQALITGDLVDVKKSYNFDHSKEYSMIFLTLFQEENKRLRMGTNRGSLEDSVNRLVKKLRTKNRFSQFDVADESKCRILFEMVQSEKKINLSNVEEGVFSDKRFEPGIIGFKFIYENQDYYYMPTDAVTYSHLTMKHVLNFMSKRMGISKRTNSISKRVSIMKNLSMKSFMITSKAFVSLEDKAIPLYRGYPLDVVFSKERLKETTINSVDWLVENMGSDGSFLYYYDPVKDTVIDHAHPKRTLSNLYNNSLRHSGGTITLLRGYELTQNKKYLEAAKKSLDFLIANTRKRTINGKIAYHIFYNHKSKLGGTGIGLAAIMRYYMISGDDSFNHYATGMVRHLISRIVEDDGEMIGYYIHPKYYDGKPILNPTPTEKKELFSFYYPGEALLGLALYEREMKNIDPDFKKEIRRLSKKALDFLVDIRPSKYSDLFTDLPADGWLMQAIEEWSLDKDFRRQAYIDFVFDDTKAMIDHMYNKDDSPFYDYPGTFYYNYGDHAYTDGARSEGLIAAYYLAKRMKKDKLAKDILDACKLAATSLLYTYNSVKSTYSHRYPKKSVGSFRFKITRQWIRVDSVQHTACFYSRLYKAF